MFVCSLNLICLQNLHQGYVPQNLTRFLKARDWDPSKAYQMVSISIYLQLLLLLTNCFRIHLSNVPYISVIFSVAWLFILETAKSDWQYIIRKFAYHCLSYLITALLALNFEVAKLIHCITYVFMVICFSETNCSCRLI
jgi:hypothetical protein